MSNDINYVLRLKDLFSKTMSGAMNNTKKMDSVVGSLGNKLAGLAAGASIVGFGKAVIESLQNYEYFSSSLRVLMKGDKNAATALQGQLVELAKTTPFSLVDVQDSSRKLLAYGFAAGEIVDQMKTLGDVSAATGNNISDVAYLYGTLKTQGKAMTKDLYQFTNRGINIIPQLAKQFGILESQVFDYASAGKIGFKDVEKAFKTMTSAGGDFFGMMEEQSKTIGGRLSNMGDAWEQLKVNIGRSQTGIIASTVNWANSMLDKLNQIVLAANRMDEAFSNAKIKGFSAMENFNNWLFGGTQNEFINKNFTGGKGKTEMFDRSIENMYTKPSGRDKMSALTSMAQITKLMSSYGKAFINKEIDKTEYDRSMAIMELAKTKIQGNLTLFKTPGNKMAGMAPGEDGEKAGKGSSSLGTGTSVTGNAPKNLNISIGKLVEELNINTTNMQETSSRIKEEVSKALLECVNDVNLMER